MRVRAPRTAPIAAQREGPPVVGQDAVEPKGIEALAVAQERQGAGHLLGRVDRHGQQPRRPVDGDEESASCAVEARQGEDIHVPEARRTRAKLAAVTLGLGPQGVQLMERQEDQLPIDRRAREMRADRLPQGQPDGVESHQPVLRHPPQQRGCLGRQRLVEGLGSRRANAGSGPTLPLGHRVHTDPYLLGLEPGRRSALPHARALLDVRSRVGVVGYGALLIG